MAIVTVFVDESFSAATSDDYFVVVIGVITQDRRRLELMTRRIRKQRVKASSEFKASVTPPKLVKRFLKELAEDSNISIVAAIWESKRDAVGDFEELYRQLVARCVLRAIKKFPRAKVHIDKRYSHKRGQQALDLEIRRALALVRGNVVQIFQEDSRRVQELAAADFVAWAFMQHYCHANAEFYNLIRARVIHMDNLSQ